MERNTGGAYTGLSQTVAVSFSEAFVPVKKLAPWGISGPSCGGRVTGLRIVRATVAGERDPDALAGLRDVRCRESMETIREAMVGNYQPERDAVELLFNALAAMAEAGRSTADGLETTGESAAALLILRECMHHLGFDGIAALASSADDAVP